MRLFISPMLTIGMAHFRSVGNCAILILLTYGGSLVNRGLLTIGDLTSLLMYTGELNTGSWKPTWN